MTKKDLRINLVNLGIHKEQCVNAAAVEQFDEDEIYEKDGHAYLIYDSELSSEEINTALLTKQANDLKTIKKMITFFAGITIVSLLISVVSILYALA